MIRSWIRTFAIVCLVAVMTALLIGCGQPDLPSHPPPAETTNGQREQDLDYLVQVIETIHPKPFL
ncbi:MAG: hypothetical protein MK100_08625, partial [Phycisphaerales bacterium]|nr:hypothetical protein [Phycisphaerales bacterium]